jgi:hypothetical protein
MMEEKFVLAVVAVIIKVNRTGNLGDSRIFVCPVNESIRIRTGERGSVTNIMSEVERTGESPREPLTIAESKRIAEGMLHGFS